MGIRDGIRKVCYRCGWTIGFFSLGAFGLRNFLIALVEIINAKNEKVWVYSKDKPKVLFKKFLNQLTSIFHFGSLARVEACGLVVSNSRKVGACRRGFTTPSRTLGLLKRPIQ